MDADVRDVAHLAEGNEQRAVVREAELIDRTARQDADEFARVGRNGGSETVDLEQPIIDAVGLALPFSPVCGPDCAGLCQECGIPLASAGPDHRHEQIDPRWAKLAELREQAGEDS